MNNRQTLYTRIDAQGNKIPGSSVLRLKSPRTGRWVAEDPNVCCFGFTALTVTPEDVTDTAFTLTVLCDATEVLTLLLVTDPATTTIEELTQLLTAKAGYLGQFSTDGTVISFKLKTEVSDGFLCDGTLTFTVVPT